MTRPLCIMMLYAHLRSDNNAGADSVSGDVPGGAVVNLVRSRRRISFQEQNDKRGRWKRAVRNTRRSDGRAVWAFIKVRSIDSACDKVQENKSEDAQVQVSLAVELSRNGAKQGSAIVLILTTISSSAHVS